MAKCPVCHSRKAKRKCFVTEEGHICSLCCGEIRQEATCAGCVYYKPPETRRKYNEVPSYTPMQMERNIDLQEYANDIEGAVAVFDVSKEKSMKDEIAIAIYEKLLDKYHFKDEAMTFQNDLLKEGFEYIDDVMESDLKDIEEETLIKIIGVLLMVAKRRSQGNREYLTFIEQYVGQRFAKGVRIMDRRPRL